MRRTILLADDSSTIQRLVTQTFADGNFEIVSVSNGEAAIRKFDEVRPDVVLADIYMPGKNGYEVCAFVKSHSSLAHTPVILLVGAFDAFDEEVARRTGAAASITKPFEPGALVELVNSVLPAVPAVKDQPAPPVAKPETPPPPVAAPAPVAEAPPAPAPKAAPPAARPEPDESDLLGLEALFKEPEPAAAMTEEDIERIADRVIQKLSSQVIESIAWEVVPDITEKVLREELKRNS